MLSSATVSKGRLLSHGKYSEQLLRRTVSSITNLYRAAGYSQAKILPRVTKSNGNLIIALTVQEGLRDTVETSAIARKRNRDAQPTCRLKDFNSRPAKPTLSNCCGRIATTSWPAI